MLSDSKGFRCTTVRFSSTPPPDPDTLGHAGQPGEMAEKDGRNGEHGDRDVPGRPSEAAGRAPHGAGKVQRDRPEEPADRRELGQEKGAETPDKGSPEEPTRVTGGSGGPDDIIGKEIREGSGDNGDDEYHAELERRLGPGWAYKPKSALLQELGWAKNEEVPEDDHGNSREPLQLENDPVVKEILRWAGTSYEGIFSSYAVSARKFAKEPELWREWGYPAPSRWPSTEQEMQGHLQKLAPVLREKGIFVEYWEKKGDGYGPVAARSFWLFVPAGDDRPTAEDLAECAWLRIAYLEGMAYPVFLDVMD